MSTYPCVGTVGRGLFAADFAGPDGKPVLFSGAIRVHRLGPIENAEHRFVFECHGKCWRGSYLATQSARWFDQHGEPTEPVVGEGVGLATEEDYYEVILPAIRRLERLLSAEAAERDLQPFTVGLADCWKFRDDN